MKKGDPVDFCDKDGRWRAGTVDHVNYDGVIVKADDEDMKYAVSDKDVRERR